MNRIIALALVATISATGASFARGGAGGGAGGGGGGGESDRHPHFTVYQGTGGNAAIGPQLQIDSFSWGETNDTSPPPPPPPPPQHDDDCMSCD